MRCTAVLRCYWTLAPARLKAQRCHQALSRGTRAAPSAHEACDASLSWMGPVVVAAESAAHAGWSRSCLSRRGWCLRRYAMFVSALEECSRDNLEFIKERALRAIAALLRAKPEGEAALLTALVNKLGDPSRKLASKVCMP